MTQKSAVLSSRQSSVRTTFARNSHAQTCDLCSVLSDGINGGHLVFNDCSGSFSLFCDPCFNVTQKIYGFLLSGDSNRASADAVTRFLRDDLRRNGIWGLYYGKTLTFALEGVRDDRERRQLGALVGTRLYVASEAGILQHPCVRPSKDHIYHLLGSQSMGMPPCKALHFLLDGICLRGIGFPHVNATGLETCPMPPDMSLTANQVLLYRELYPTKEFCSRCKVKKTRKSTLYLCSGCRGVVFCSRRCQMEFWPVHRLVCKQIRAHDRTVSEAKKCHDDDKARLF